MKKLCRYLSLPVIFSMLVTAAVAQEETKVEIVVTQIADHIYVLSGPGGNIGLSVGEEAVFLIDDKYAPLIPAVKKGVATVTDRPVSLILNTHWHGDHTGGNEDFRNDGAIIISHDNVRKRMSTEQFRSVFNRTTPASPGAALPIVTFDDDLTMHINDDVIRVVHVPHAHTDGDTILKFKNANVIHTGDIVFNGVYPFIDVDSGGSVLGIINGVELMLAMSDENTKFIPGHGSVTATADDLRAYLSMLVTVRDRISQMIREGKTIEEVQASDASAEYDAEWTWNFINPELFKKLVYLSLSPSGEPDPVPEETEKTN